MVKEEGWETEAMQSIFPTSNPFKTAPESLSRRQFVA